MIKIEVHSTQAVIRCQEPLTVGLRGAKARFAFGQPWEALTKTAVFRQGDQTVTVARVGQEVTIPWEVLLRPGVPVEIGVYGTDSEGSVAIPTVWAVTDPVRPGADPEGDPSAEPTPGLWEQMQGKLGGLEQQMEGMATALKVTLIPQEDGSYKTDLPFAEILAANEAGSAVFCQNGTRVLPLVVAAKSLCAFACVHNGVVYTVLVSAVGVDVSTQPLPSAVSIRDDGDGNVTITATAAPANEITV